MHPAGGNRAHRLPKRASAVTVLVVVALFFTPFVPTGASASGAGVPDIDLAFERYTLTNGLEVILHVDERLPVAAVNLWYHVGPADERPDRRGFAHLFEHLMFEGSGHVPEGRFDTLLEAAGSSNNASTSYDYTNYLIPSVGADQLELALWLEADRMGFLLDAVDQQSLSSQQAVVRNERRQSENEPYGLVPEEMFHRLFPAEHPYHAGVIGSHEDIQSATLDDIRDFHRTYYVPDNATLAVAGNLDVAQTKRWIDKYFGTIPAGPDVPEATVVTPPLSGEQRVTMTDEVELDLVTMAWLAPPIFSPGDAEGVITAEVLGEGAASRLERALVHDQQIAQYVTAYQYSLEHGSVFVAEAQAKPGHDAAEIEAAMQAEIDRLGRDGPTAGEVSAGQASTTAGIVRNLQDLGGFGGRADQLNMYNHYVGDPGFLDEDLARYAAVTPEAVRTFVTDVLRPDRRLVIHVTPGERVLPPDPPAPDAPPDDGAAKPAPAEPWRNEIPGPGPERAAATPTALQFELDNGLAVLFVEEHRLPIVTASVVSKMGSASDPPRRPGLASLTTDLLAEGTRQRDALEVAAAADALGTSLRTNTGADQASVGVQVLTPDAGGAVGLLAESVRSPAFDRQAFERVRDDHQVGIVEAGDDPEEAAGQVAGRNLYGAGHPYGHPPLGTAAGLERSDRDQVRRFWRRSFNPANAALVLAGDLTVGEARDLAATHFRSWKPAGAEPLPEPGRGAPAGERVLIVDTPGAGQTALVAAQPGVSRSDPDYESLQIMNLVLGGSFTSRLNTNLRETHGYTYGAYSEVQGRRGPGLVTASSQVETGVTGPAVREILHEVKAMGDSGVTDEELARAKASRSSAAAFRFGTGEDTAATLGDLFVFGLPLDYWQTLPARIEPLTTADIYTVARKHLRPEEMKIIAVGDRAEIEPQLAELQLGPTGYRAADGRPVE